jgi:hypothetical protein
VIKQKRHSGRSVGIPAWAFQRGHSSVGIPAWAFQRGHSSVGIPAWAFQRGHSNNSKRLKYKLTTQVLSAFYHKRYDLETTQRRATVALPNIFSFSASLSERHIFSYSL